MPVVDQQRSRVNIEEDLSKTFFFSGALVKIGEAEVRQRQFRTEFRGRGRN